MTPDLLFLVSAPTAGTVGSGSMAIDRDTGREWVERELSKQEYSATDLTPLEQIGRWISSLWDSLVNAALRSHSPWLLLLVALALAAIIALIVWRVRRAGLRRTGLPLTAFDPVVSLPEPGPWRQSAARAAQAGDYRAAVIDASRAIFAVLSIRRIISLESSATASELARETESSLPDHAAAVHSVAEIFNDLLYGDRFDGGERPDQDLPEVYARLCELDRTLSSLPVRQRQEASA